MDKVANVREDIARAIANKWGWGYDILLDFLKDGGISGTAFEQVSAAQTANAIIEALTKR